MRRKITVYIDEEIYKGLLKEVELQDWAEGCVDPPGVLARAMAGIIKKIQEDSTKAIIGKKK